MVLLENQHSMFQSGYHIYIHYYLYSLLSIFIIIFIRYYLLFFRASKQLADNMIATKSWNEFKSKLDEKKVLFILRICLLLNNFINLLIPRNSNSRLVDVKAPGCVFQFCTLLLTGSNFLVFFNSLSLFCRSSKHHSAVKNLAKTKSRKTVQGKLQYSIFTDVF